MSYKERKLNRKRKKAVKTMEQYTTSRLASPDFATPKMSKYEKRKFAKLQKTNKQINELKPKKIMDSGTFNNSSTQKMADSPTMGYNSKFVTRYDFPEPVRRIENVSEFIKPEIRPAESPRIIPNLIHPKTPQVDYRKLKR